MSNRIAPADSQLLADLDSGLSREALAARYGLSIRTVESHCRRLGRLVDPVTDRHCPLCERPLGRANRSGYCKACTHNKRHLRHQRLKALWQQVEAGP